MKVFVETITLNYSDKTKTLRECQVFLSKEDAIKDTKCVVKHYCRGYYDTEEYKKKLAGTDSVYRLYMTREDEELKIEIFEKEL